MAFTGSGRNRPAAPHRGRLTRRAFLGTAGVAGTLLLRQGQALSYEANEQLQVAVVGLGGRGSGFAVEEGWSSVRRQTGGRIAALCDVNKKKAAEAFQRYPDVPKYEDFRVMIDEMGAKLDAVIVATPDHVHAAPSADDRAILGCAPGAVPKARHQLPGEGLRAGHARRRCREAG